MLVFYKLGTYPQQLSQLWQFFVLFQVKSSFFLKLGLLLSDEKDNKQDKKKQLFLFKQTSTVTTKIELELKLAKVAKKLKRKKSKKKKKEIKKGQSNVEATSQQMFL